MINDYWKRPAEICENNFVAKSLSNWSLNIAVGCGHACTFCYVPNVSTRKLAAPLAKFGVEDPAAQWGEYVLLRPFDSGVFNRSLKTAEHTRRETLARDGNRAVMLCTTTDPYQVMRHPDVSRRRHLQEALEFMVRESLSRILEQSTLNVRILTRSPMARKDFDIMKRFGKRLMFGMSLPTTNAALAKAYEPHAPAPAQRLATLIEARRQGLNTFVAIAPTYPECDESDLLKTFEAVAECDPLTVFHEPINIRGENIEKIRKLGESLGLTMRPEVFDSGPKWRSYAVEQLKSAEHCAQKTGLRDRLHLWPDKLTLGSKAAHEQFSGAYSTWLEACWNRISEWPK